MTAWSYFPFILVVIIQHSCLTTNKPSATPIWATLAREKYSKSAVRTGSSGRQWQAESQLPSWFFLLNHIFTSSLICSTNCQASPQFQNSTCPPSFFRLVPSSKKLQIFLEKKLLFLWKSCSLWVSDNFRFNSLSFLFLSFYDLLIKQRWGREQINKNVAN